MEYAFVNFQIEDLAKQANQKLDKKDLEVCFQLNAKFTFTFSHSTKFIAIIYIVLKIKSMCETINLPKVVLGNCRRLLVKIGVEGTPGGKFTGGRPSVSLGSERGERRCNTRYTGSDPWGKVQPGVEHEFTLMVICLFKASLITDRYHLTTELLLAIVVHAGTHTKKKRTSYIISCHSVIIKFDES